MDRGESIPVVPETSDPQSKRPWTRPVMVSYGDFARLTGGSGTKGADAGGTGSTSKNT